MTEREKIIKVIDEWANKAVKANKFDGASVYNPHNAAELADALIAAGIGDIREAERRAARAERALENACVVILSSRNGEQPRRLRAYYKAYLEAAEKELAEEREDEQT